MIDSAGFRHGVGIVLVNNHQQVFWARRIGKKNAWQFPQGGLQRNESPEDALYRELHEEVGLVKADVRLMASTANWLSYALPRKFRRHYSKPLCIGQKQKWYLLQLMGDEGCIDFNQTNTPEFDQWQWVSYWKPLQRVISFKRRIYKSALKEFAPYVF